TGTAQNASSAIARITADDIRTCSRLGGLQGPTRPHSALEYFLRQPPRRAFLRCRPRGACRSGGVVVKMNRVGRVRFGEENDLPGVHREVLDDMINRRENSVVALLHHVWARKIGWG